MPVPPARGEKGQRIPAGAARSRHPSSRGTTPRPAPAALPSETRTPVPTGPAMPGGPGRTRRRPSSTSSPPPPTTPRPRTSPRRFTTLKPGMPRRTSHKAVRVETAPLETRATTSRTSNQRLYRPRMRRGKPREMRTGGNWSTNTGTGRQGGLQFDSATWAAYGGDKFASSADQATKEQQIAVAERVRSDRGGYSAWPACADQLGLPK
ncbi:transglycosylase family protein [Pseudonocardia terrae]|uniref:transglycosylase family protein n=1 Tax=Pseudonocardia terrae TaxID=2905831 RepID=UPI0027E03226|nr:transglycosylase family protein [Pseudonocardia terrae]